jgi:hypothetical protein
VSLSPDDDTLDDLTITIRYDDGETEEDECNPHVTPHWIPMVVVEKSSAMMPGVAPST